MFPAYKNSYLQLTTSVDPKVVNKAVRRAMRKTQFDPHDELPPAQRMESMQPSLYGPWVDITRTRMGFERVGLRIINRDINSDDSFVKLQAIHTVLDQVQISENALFLINLNIVYKLIELLTDPDPIIREKVCIILTHLGNYYQGQKRILSQPVVIDRLMSLFTQDRKEIRYPAALCLKNLTSHGCETIIKNDKIVENLLKMIKNDHVGIVLLHLESLKNLADWDPTKPLKENAFQVMMELMSYSDTRISRAAMDCLRQLCKHSVGKKLADNYDLTRLLLPYLYSPDIHVIISTLGLMEYTSLTTRSKWRIKEFVYGLCNRLVILCMMHDVPVLQLRAMQVLINLCNCPDSRRFIRRNLGKYIKRIKIRSPDQWDGTTETNQYGFEFGHYYRTRYVNEAETIKTDFGDNVEALNVYSYLEQVKRTKERLIKMMKFLSYKH